MDPINRGKLWSFFHFGFPRGLGEPSFFCPPLKVTPVPTPLIKVTPVPTLLKAIRKVTCLSGRLSVRPSVCPSLRQSVRLPVGLSVRPSVGLSASLSVCLPASPSVRPSVSLSVCRGETPAKNTAKTRGFEVGGKTIIEKPRVFKQSPVLVSYFCVPGGNAREKHSENAGF